jgi:hypothetical protein
MQRRSGPNGPSRYTVSQLLPFSASDVADFLG